MLTVLTSEVRFFAKPQNVVNMDKITAFSAQGLDVGNTSIPVGRSYKEQVHTYLKSKPI